MGQHRDVTRPVRQRRTAQGVLLGLGGIALATAILLPVRDDVSRATPALVLVVPIVLSGLVGGRRPALVSALVAAVAFNVGFIPPYGTPDIHEVDDIVALVVFGFVALTVGTLIARASERQASAEARAVELDQLNEELRAVQRDRERLAEEATQAAVLKRVDEQRSALLRSVSHDLRTPLAGIRAVGSDLLSGVDYDEATRRELLTLVVDEAERLDRLVANLLSLSRIEAGALQPERAALAVDDLVDDAVQRVGRIFSGQRLQVDLPSDLPLVRGDYTQLHQVVVNLLENAARHGPPGSMVHVGARATKGHVEVWVDDEGAGVPPFERERIFDAFRTGEGSSSSGIGLAICKAVVEAHDGRISVDQSPTNGARFAFTVPQA
jgi:two-component system sensor histidine kinase KdpD